MTSAGQVLGQFSGESGGGEFQCGAQLREANSAESDGGNRQGDGSQRVVVWGENHADSDDSGFCFLVVDCESAFADECEFPAEFVEVRALRMVFVQPSECVVIEGCEQRHSA